MVRNDRSLRLRDHHAWCVNLQRRYGSEATSVSRDALGGFLQPQCSCFYELGRTINRERGGTLGIQALWGCLFSLVRGSNCRQLVYCARNTGYEQPTTSYLSPKAEPCPGSEDFCSESPAASAARLAGLPDLPPFLGLAFLFLLA